MVTGIGPARQLARHQRELRDHPRIAQQQKQSLLAAVSDRLREEDKIYAAPEPVAKEGPKTTSRSVSQRAKEVHQLLLQQARGAFGNDAKQKLHALALLMYAFTLDHTSPATAQLIEKCETAAKTHAVGASMLHDVNHNAVSLLTDATDTYEYMDKTRREWIGTGVGVDDSAKLTNEAKAIGNGALDFGQEFGKANEQFHSSHDFDTFKSAAEALFAVSHKVQRAKRELDSVRSQFSTILEKSTEYGNQIREKVRHALTVLADEATSQQNVASASDKLRDDFELLREHISKKLDEINTALSLQDFLKELASNDFVSTYRTLLGNLNLQLQSTPQPPSAPATVHKGVSPAPATKATPKEEAEGWLQQILDTVTRNKKITTQNVTGIVLQLSKICSLDETEFFTEIQGAQFTVPATIAETWMNKLNFVEAQHVEEGVRDKMRKILRVFEVSYLKGDAGVTRLIHTPWFALSEHPEVTDADHADVPKLIQAISRMYKDETQHASALPPHSAYEFVRAVVRNPVHAGNAQLTKLVDTANKLIEAENELMRKLGIGLHVPPFPPIDAADDVTHHVQEALRTPASEERAAAVDMWIVRFMIKQKENNTAGLDRLNELDLKGTAAAYRLNVNRTHELARHLHRICDLNRAAKEVRQFETEKTAEIEAMKMQFEGAFHHMYTKASSTADLDKQLEIVLQAHAREQELIENLDSDFFRMQLRHIFGSSVDMSILSQQKLAIMSALSSLVTGTADFVNESSFLGTASALLGFTGVPARREYIAGILPIAISSVSSIADLTAAATTDLVATRIILKIFDHLIFISASGDKEKHNAVAKPWVKVSLNLHPLKKHAKADDKRKQRVNLLCKMYEDDKRLPHLPPYGAYRVVAEAQEKASGWFSDDELQRLSALIDADTSLAADSKTEARKELRIATGFGEAHIRRKYAMSPWTAV
jgi:hypothetical protein